MAEFNNGMDDGFERRQKIHNQFLIIEDYRDFIEWLFETHIEWISEGEAWDEFREYQSKRNEQVD